MMRILKARKVDFIPFFLVYCESKLLTLKTGSPYEVVVHHFGLSAKHAKGAKKERTLKIRVFFLSELRVLSACLR
jgi:hypothetical protein